MSEKNTTTHILIDRQLTIYKRERSDVWQCRFKCDGRWQRCSTKERTLKEAKAKAHDILVEANVKKKLNIAPVTRKFRDVARIVLKKLKNNVDEKTAKSVYKDYITAIEKYLMPVLSSYNINSITQAELDKLDKERIKKMRKIPTRSTLLTHNATLNMIFDEAEKLRFMTVLDRPKLVAKGKESIRRAAFDMEEVLAIKANFNNWIKQATTNTSKNLRTLLREYVYVLLDTGARPGKELLNLKWKQIRHTNSDSDGDRFVEMTVSGKTGARRILGWIDTVNALQRLLKAQGLVGLEKTTEQNYEGYVFRTSDNKIPQSFNKLFETFLKEHNLLIDPNTNQKRVFYSLRHTYATFKLVYDKTPIHTLAEHMGTSTLMIEKHYSHLRVKDAMPQLKGKNTRTLLNSNKRINPTYSPNKTKEEKMAEIKVKRSEGGKKSGVTRKAKALTKSIKVS
jgi:integrase